MAAAAPSAQGTFAETPLLHLLVYALDRRLNGTLVIEDGSQQRHAIYFDAGAPTKARAAEPLTRLGEVLVELGHVDRPSVDGALDRARRERKLIGAVLLESGAIDQDALTAGLLEQLGRILLHLQALPPDTVFGYYEGIDYLERLPPHADAMAALSLIWRVARDGARPELAAEVVGRLSDNPIRLHVAAPIVRFGFEPRVQAVVDVLRAKPQPMLELTGRGLVEPDTLNRLLYTLMLLRHVDLGNGLAPLGAAPTTPAPGALFSSKPPVPAEQGRVSTPKPSAAPAPGATRSQSPAPVPAPSAAPKPPEQRTASSPAVEVLRAEIKRRAELTNASYYEILGVPADAPTTAIQSAFFQLAKTLHPDRLGPELGDVRDLASRVFARLSEAHQVLADPQRRREYDSLQSSGDDAEQEQVQRVLRAATAYQKALVLLKRNNLEAAEQEARKAAEDDTEQADYVALLAWIEGSKPGADLAKAVTTLDRAARMEENNLRVRWYRGQLLKRLGKENRALSDFRFILERDPRHVDAQREIRLHEMRRHGQKSSDPAPGSSSTGFGAEKAPKSDKPGGVLGRLFKKQ